MVAVVVKLVHDAIVGVHHWDNVMQSMGPCIRTVRLQRGCERDTGLMTCMNHIAHVTLFSQRSKVTLALSMSLHQCATKPRAGSPGAWDKIVLANSSLERPEESDALENSCPKL